MISYNQSNQFIFKQKWILVPILRKFPRDVTEIAKKRTDNWKKKLKKKLKQAYFKLSVQK